ncbi:MAG TPA: type II toxin-antitoxin system VapC family toxin [Kofleriaceae bacterium]|nr:type II toxin-antitoxin system VapC family toxin [Kofleriaceae bacterium]
MPGLYHIDTDFLVYSLSVRGPERRRMTRLLESGSPLEASSLVWYEFARGPRMPEQLAIARDLFGPDGILPFSEELAEAAADQFRRLGSPRKRAADIAIGVVARSRGAILLTRNKRDFAGIDGLILEQVG